MMVGSNFLYAGTYCITALVKDNSRLTTKYLSDLYKAEYWQENEV